MNADIGVGVATRLIFVLTGKGEKMSRLIDADALKEVICDNVYPVADYFNSRDYGMFWTGGIEKAIDEMPTIDAEPIVRCKDCRWGREVCGNIECSVDRNLPPEYHGYEWFCPNGERRTNEVN